MRDDLNKVAVSLFDLWSACDMNCFKIKNFQCIYKMQVPKRSTNVCLDTDGFVISEFDFVLAYLLPIKKIIYYINTNFLQLAKQDWEFI